MIGHGEGENPCMKNRKIVSCFSGYRHVCWYDHGGQGSNLVLESGNNPRSGVGAFSWGGEVAYWGQLRTCTSLPEVLVFLQAKGSSPSA